MWDADVSNRGFVTSSGYAFSPKADSLFNRKKPNPDLPEVTPHPLTARTVRKALVTQDDHLMLLPASGKSPAGNPFYREKFLGRSILTFWMVMYMCRNRISR